MLRVRRQDADLDPQRFVRGQRDESLGLQRDEAREDIRMHERPFDCVRVRCAGGVVCCRELNHRARAVRRIVGPVRIRLERVDEELRLGWRISEDRVVDHPTVRRRDDRCVQPVEARVAGLAPIARELTLAHRAVLVEARRRRSASEGYGQARGRDRDEHGHDDRPATGGNPDGPLVHSGRCSRGNREGHVERRGTVRGDRQSGGGLRVRPSPVRLRVELDDDRNGSGDESCVA